MARKNKRDPKQPAGDPKDPKGMIALMEQFFEWMRMQELRRVDRRRHDRALLRRFINWAAARGVAQPAEVTKPIIERYQRFLFHYRKRTATRLSFQPSTTASCGGPGMVPMAGSQQPRPLQPRRRHRVATGRSTGCRNTC